MPTLKVIRVELWMASRGTVEMFCGAEVVVWFDPRLTNTAAAQIRDLMTRLIEAGAWREGDPWVVFALDAGYDVIRLSYLLGRSAGDPDLPDQRPERPDGRWPGTVDPATEPASPGRKPDTWTAPAPNATPPTPDAGRSRCAGLDRTDPGSTRPRLRAGVAAESANSNTTGHAQRGSKQPAG